MPVENANFIHELNSANPVGTDPISEADDHLRNIKASIKGSFSAIAGAVTSSHDDVNLLSGKAITTARDNAATGIGQADIDALHGSQDASEADTTTFRGMINAVTSSTISGDGIIGVTNGTDTFDNDNASETGVPFNSDLTISHAAKATSLSDIAVTANTVLNSVSFDSFGHVSAVGTTSVFPAGMIVLWSGATDAVPTGWVLCDGQNNTPDLRNRFVVGAGSTYAVGATGGSTSVTLGSANLPSHTHTFSGTTSSKTLTGSISVVSEPFASYGSASGVFSKGSARSAGTPQNTDTSGVGSLSFNGTHSHTYNGTTDETGSGTAFDTIPPYYALAYIMKT